MRNTLYSLGLVGVLASSAIAQSWPGDGYAITRVRSRVVASHPVEGYFPEKRPCLVKFHTKYGDFTDEKKYPYAHPNCKKYLQEEYLLSLKIKHDKYRGPIDFKVEFAGAARLQNTDVLDDIIKKRKP